MKYKGCLYDAEKDKIIVEVTGESHNVMTALMLMDRENQSTNYLCCVSWIKYSLLKYTGLLKRYILS